jgi:hypothetical protein
MRKFPGIQPTMKSPKMKGEPWIHCTGSLAEVEDPQKSLTIFVVVFKSKPVHQCLLRFVEA